MEKIIISAPFGNWIQSNIATSTVGTYTLADRAGPLRWRLFWKLLTTLRWKSGLGGWANRLGLPNPGIASLSEQQASGKILSIHGFDVQEWRQLIEKGKDLNPLSIELNVSCPNVREISINDQTFGLAMQASKSVIVKLPPANYWPLFLRAHRAGVTTFHCCNTLPIPAGGLSGKTLKKISLDVVSRIKDYDSTLKIIGGGGITQSQDIADYRFVGAEHFAVGSALFHPKYWWASTRNAFFEELQRS